jgi:hypothetical protein
LKTLLPARFTRGAVKRGAASGGGVDFGRRALIRKRGARAGQHGTADFSGKNERDFLENPVIFRKNPLDKRKKPC